MDGDIRLELRTNNWNMDFLLATRYGYGAYEARHMPNCLGPVIHLALDSTGDVYQIDDSKVKEGPAIQRQNGITRGKNDTKSMMYASRDGVRFLYRSKFRPCPANREKNEETSENLENQTAILQEYAERMGGKYLPPEPARRVSGMIVYDDGGFRANGVNRFATTASA